LIHTFRVKGDVPETARMALADRDIPLGLTALSPFQGGISRFSLTDYADSYPVKREAAYPSIALWAVNPEEFGRTLKATASALSERHFKYAPMAVWVACREEEM
jgi:hypothetical protein